VIGTRVSRIKSAVKPLTGAVARAEFSLLLLVVGAALPAGCSSAPTGLPGASTGAGGNGSSAPAGGSGSGSIPDGPPPFFDTAPVGWAAVADLGLNGTTGGDGGPAVEVSTLEDFVAQVATPGPRVVYLSGVIGDGRRVTIQSNISVIGRGGAEFRGGLRVDGGSNVIVRNLKVVGNNCSDSPTDCSGGADAFSIGDGAHHVWVDHCDVSDGSDGNLDINGQADYVTISWTKFSYSGQRPGGHQFSNLIGSSDDNPEDTGHLRVTWHHNWWADNIHERMPRVRYGRVHLFNNLYTASGNDYCIGLGYYANLLTEHNAFFQVRDPINSTNYSNSQSVVISHDNLYVATSGGTSDKGFPNEVFVPPYPYALDAANDVEALVKNGAGTCSPPLAFATAPSLSCSR
jgi:pectate lyase